MHPDEAVRARTAALELAHSLGLPAQETVDLHDSNRLTLRLLPADTVARVAPAGFSSQLELDRARILAAAGAPVGAPEPRTAPQVHERGGFEIGLWTFHAPRTDRELPPQEYARALAHLHAAMRSADLQVPSFTTRVDSALALVEDSARTPRLPGPDRSFLREVLGGFGAEIARRPGQQVLHGEPHPGNLLNTEDGVLVIDFETMCSGPVEFDLAHAPPQVAQHYPGADAALLTDCRILSQAIATTWRWDREDSLPDGAALGRLWLQEVRDLVAVRA
ncbi:phosphotransferase family protein [Brachybacterium sp. YJGR34]|uniref:phosphotransferase family protein n=1 Tax=Brachybacterium sp. YJGR34 TaxID=2059911 RepID=UPI000E0AA7DA|nr:phosphotransferase [Brachybacterium sp. YJGR34]